MKKNQSKKENLVQEDKPSNEQKALGDQKDDTGKTRIFNKHKPRNGISNDSIIINKALSEKKQEPDDYQTNEFED